MSSSTPSEFPFTIEGRPPLGSSPSTLSVPPQLSHAGNALSQTNSSLPTPPLSSPTPQLPPGSMSNSNVGLKGSIYTHHEQDSPTSSLEDLDFSISTPYTSLRGGSGLDLRKVSNRAEAEALVHKTQKEVLDLADVPGEEVVPETDRVPLSARLAAYGDILALERRFAKGEKQREQWTSRSDSEEDVPTLPKTPRNAALVCDAAFGTPRRVELGPVSPPPSKSSSFQVQRRHRGCGDLIRQRVMGGVSGMVPLAINYQPRETYVLSGCRLDLSGTLSGEGTFKTLLRQKDINPLLPWDTALPQFFSDPRYVLLPSVAARCEAFNEYCRDRARDLRAAMVAPHKAEGAKEEFDRLLREEVKSMRTVWSEWRKSWKKGRRFYGWGQDDREREKRFREWIKELHEQKRAAARKTEADFIGLLKEKGGIKPDSIWKEVQRKLVEDPRYDPVGSSSLCEECFNTKVKTLSAVSCALGSASATASSSRSDITKGSVDDNIQLSGSERNELRWGKG
ncbi:hypothetical protein BD410DRAFT_844459 [Rickenella mellea]|uniref:FF domain-containing protein n=1 Tax=Rickenella mellea TaxID=50990 RepID=A0A4Y7PN07_9AGAM|nr:hypothetical protein BD410DRAFT_844459 [Rickenella mellea]